MKKSNYILCVNRNNGVLLYNSFTDSYAVLSNAVYKDFVETELNVFQIKHSTVYDNLVSLGMIIPDDEDELSILRYKNKLSTFSSRNMKIVIYPTQDCNLKCWYCYENHVPNTRMKEETMNKIYKFVQRNLNENTFDEILITFFGGEPMIDFAKIAYPICKKIKKEVETKGKSFSVFFVTNASLINDNIICKLAEFNPYFQITIDGNKKRHDTIRIWKKGNLPTYDHIISVVHKLASKIDAKHFITFRINYDNETLNDAEEILKDISDIDRNKIFIHFERVWQTGSQRDFAHSELLKKTMLNFIKEGFCVDQWAFHATAYSCPSDINNSFVINYNGTVHKCNGRTLSDLTQYGILQDDGSMKLDYVKLAKRLGASTFEHKQCLACKMLPVCMGPCSQKLLEHGGVWNDEICKMNSLDTSLDDYLLMDFCVKSMLSDSK